MMIVKGTDMEHFTAQAVEAIKRGEYVRKIGKDGQMQAKTYVRGGYDIPSQRYSLTDFDSVSREVWVKKGTKLAVGFTF